MGNEADRPQARKPKKQGAKTFKAGFNLETFTIFMIPNIVAIVLILLGTFYDRLFPPQLGMGSRMTFVFLPMIFGGFIVIMSVLTLHANLSIKITITPQGLIYKQGSKEFESTWENLIYRAPSKFKKGYFKTIMLSDGNIVAYVNSSFFPRFKLLVDLLNVAKAQYKSGDYNLKSAEFYAGDDLELS